MQTGARIGFNEAGRGSGRREAKARVGYLNRGTRLHYVTEEGPLYSTAKVQRFRPAEGEDTPTCRSCLLALANGRGRLRYEEVQGEDSKEGV